jgi:hypothetical protein
MYDMCPDDLVKFGWVIAGGRLTPPASARIALAPLNGGEFYEISIASRRDYCIVAAVALKLNPPAEEDYCLSGRNTIK